MPMSVDAFLRSPAPRFEQPDDCRRSSPREPRDERDDDAWEVWDAADRAWLPASTLKAARAIVDGTPARLAEGSAS